MAGASELKLNYFRKMFTLVEQAEPVVGKKKVDRYTTPFLSGSGRGFANLFALTTFTCEGRSSSGNLFLCIFI